MERMHDSLFSIGSVVYSLSPQPPLCFGSSQHSSFSATSRTDILKSPYINIRQRKRKTPDWQENLINFAFKFSSTLDIARNSHRDKQNPIQPIGTTDCPPFVQ
ncbi:hypothetical protein TWF506_007052 [Arthrobotrys conoides]|uniref:Uncharacterized protein n=1 Tax=Arthrobotrys conoides TaxID=74498 RepID=A0AAN8P4S7_9PEZI